MSPLRPPSRAACIVSWQQIGEKVKLSETIVNVMRKMRCPHPMQANQIQGSDWVNVYPVIIWMVKKFFENREQV